MLLSIARYLKSGKKVYNLKIKDMPTGYTAGIIDGKINTFEEFAHTCIRAMGAAVHMRDEPIGKEFEPALPDSYYKESIEESRKKLLEISSMTNEELVRKKKEGIENSIKEYQEYIDKAKKNRIKLEGMLRQAKAYTPPTEDHQGIKDLMVEQLTITIDADGDSSYYEKELERLKESLKNLNADKIRRDLLEREEDSLKYSEEQYKKEVARCDERNKWVEEFINSL